jgi:hypothetical protein
MTKLIVTKYDITLIAIGTVLTVISYIIRDPILSLIGMGILALGLYE